MLSFTRTKCLRLYPVGWIWSDVQSSPKSKLGETSFTFLLRCIVSSAEASTVDSSLWVLTAQVSVLHLCYRLPETTRLQSLLCYSCALTVRDMVSDAVFDPFMHELWRLLFFFRHKQDFWICTFQRLRWTLMCWSEHQCPSKCTINTNAWKQLSTVVRSGRARSLVFLCIYWSCGIN